MIFPSRSISKLFDLTRYLRIAFILIRLNFGPSNLFKSLTFGYPLYPLIVVKKKFKSYAVISLAGLSFLSENFLGLIKVRLCTALKAYVTA